MTEALATQASMTEKISSTLIHGDLSKLTQEEKTGYYMTVCKTLGLNPTTKPFAYISLNNKLVLYATKDATEQLRKIHEVSVLDLVESTVEGVFIVKAKVSDKSGRQDAATGAVNIGGLKGDMLANAMMKAETKAKRRATLSICGLGMLDETEIETIPDARPWEETAAANTPNLGESTQKAGAGRGNSIQEYVDAGLIDEAVAQAALTKYRAVNYAALPKSVADRMIEVGVAKEKELTSAKV